MTDTRVPGLLSWGLACALFFVAGCGGGDQGPTQPDDTPSGVATIEVSPTDAERAVLGGTVDFEATARAEDGTSVSGVSFDWTVRPDSGMAIDDEGTVSVRAVGTVTVEASARGVTGTAELNVRSCPDVAFPSSSVVPLDTVGVGTLPDALQAPVHADVVAGRDTGRVFVGRRDSGSGFLVAPVRPGGDLEGGEIRVRITDGTRYCSPKPLTISGLSRAPGTFEATVDSLDSVLDLQARLLGVSRQELADANLDALPRTAWPLVVAHDLITGSDNPNSMRAILEGSAPLLDRLGEAGSSRALTDALLARTDVRAALGAQLDRMRSRLGSGGSSDRYHAAGATRVECGPGSITDAPTLDSCMATQHSAGYDLDELAGVRKKLGTLYGAVGLVPGAGIPAAAAGAALFLHATVLEGTAKLLPSRFADGGVNFTETSYREDEAGPDRWKDAWVKAASEGWSLDQTVLSALLQILGSAGAYDDYVNGFMKGSDVVQSVREFLLSDVTSRMVGATKGTDIIRIPADTTPRVFIDEKKWSRRKIRGDAVAWTGHRTYEPREVGTAEMEVGTDHGEFPGDHYSRTTDVTVREISVEVTPGERIVQPGEVATYEVTVHRASDPSIEVGASAGKARVVSSEDSVHTIEVRTPGDRETFPLLMSARSTATGGARSHSTEPRVGHGTVRVRGSMDVHPQGACVTREGTQDFDATVRGITGADVQWSASAGRISPDGTFTAPDRDVDVDITATTAADTTVRAFASAMVRDGCNRWWTAHGAGRSAAGDSIIWLPDDEGSESWYLFAGDAALWVQVEENETAASIPVGSSQLDDDLGVGAPWDAEPYHVPYLSVDRTETDGGVLIRVYGLVVALPESGNPYVAPIDVRAYRSTR